MLLFLLLIIPSSAFAEPVGNIETGLKRLNVKKKEPAKAFPRPAFNLHNQNKKKTPQIILAQPSDNKTFDPFIDYGDFQDNVAEEESLSFFQHGRSLSIIFSGGYQGVTFNMRQIYGDSLFIAGLGASFFINFHIAFQVNGIFPTNHYNSLYNISYRLFNFGLDMKYYWKEQYLNEEKNFINPYFIVGSFLLNTKPILSDNQNQPEIPIVSTNTAQTTQDQANTIGQDERSALASENSIGLKTGAGLEFNLSQQIFIGFEITHLYANLLNEDQDLSQATLPPLPSLQNQNILTFLQYPQRPEVRGYKFYGDLFQITVTAGINF